LERWNNPPPLYLCRLYSFINIYSQFPLLLFRRLAQKKYRFDLESDFDGKPPVKKKEKKSRGTSKHMHDAMAQQGREKRKKSNAVKDATMMFAAERKKKEGGDTSLDSSEKKSRSWRRKKRQEWMLLLVNKQHCKYCIVRR